MKTLPLLFLIALSANALASPALATTASTPAPAAVKTDALYDRLSALDSEVFDAFNHCDVAGQLDRHASYFSPDVEFYHDTGGVTWTRDAMIANTKKYVCGHFRRELVPGSLRVYPIKDFGAIVQGTHRFCHFDTGACEGVADFAIVWREKDGQWQITRVLSYGHRPND